MTQADFQKFRAPVARQFERMSKHPLFRVKLDKDALWLAYLSSFPEGTNRIYRERREYDCSCCRQFVRAVGNVVAIIDGQLSSVWDVTCEEPAYQAVADSLSALVRGCEIENAFLSPERTAGTDKSFEQLTDGVLTWNHFFVNIPSHFVRKGVEIGPLLAETRALHDVLLRSLTELTDQAIDTVLELIGQNSLYRGEEHKFALEKYRALKRDYALLPDGRSRDAFVWSRVVGETPASVLKIRNTSIGTLLVDLSSGMDLEEAVRRFEVVVAPSNYKRPTALVTPKMVEAAKKTLTELGLISALQRRYARLEDISVNDILFADRSARQVISGDVFDSIATQAVTRKTFDKVEKVPVETFIREILPSAESVEVLFENRHAGNLVSLVAPVDPTANALFKWSNSFSWSYQGDLADSIKERVKKAGGSVTGDLLCRLAWFNHDDLDLHMKEPGYEIYYGNKRIASPSGGMLDVDMNAGQGTTRTPVENIFYTKRRSMREGVYELYVHQFSKREAIDVGFDIEFDWLGAVNRFSYAKALRYGENISVVKFRYSAERGVEIIESLPSSQASRSSWGLKTQEFQRVSVVMLSPNHWGERSVGNKHYFFMLAGCQNEGQARGFFNEFLHEGLTPHRKVIEMVGAKMKTDECSDQLSGLGFSSTQRNELLVRVKGAFTRTVNVIF